MKPNDAQQALTEGHAATDVARAFMHARASVPVTTLCSDLMDLMEGLDSNIGPWTLEPPGQLSTLRIQSEVLSAFSIAWKGNRPADKGWRFELRAVVLILNGRYRTIPSVQLLDDVGQDLAQIISVRQPPRVVFKGKKKGAKVTVALAESAANEDAA